MGMWICDEVFKTKKEFIEHIKKEQAEASEIELNAVDDVLRCDEILEELKRLEQVKK